MKGNFLISRHGSNSERDIYADKSALVIQWLLLKGIGKEEFSLRETAIQCGASIGLVQGVFDTLVLEGNLSTTGLRTNKRFKLKNPNQLLEAWLAHYNITKKCKMWTYRTGLSGRKELLERLKSSPFRNKVSLALHLAAETLGCKNTNLETLELYLLDPVLRPQLEKKLQLEPQERGYEVLLIKPFYKSILAREKTGKELVCSPPLLTYLDLYHFPLRGREQAEYMEKRVSELNKIYKRD